MPSNDQDPPGLTTMARLREIAVVFMKLGFTAFGGPMAHLAMMESEIVTRRQWCDRRTFLNLAAAVNFIPGPNSTELAIHLGYLRAGLPGLLLAGVCFITPAVLIILPIAFLYVRYDTLPEVQPILHTMSAVILAIIVVAVIRLARSTLNDPFAIAIAVMTATLWTLGVLDIYPISALLAVTQPEIVLLAISAVAGIAWRARPGAVMGFLPLGVDPGIADVQIPPDPARWTQMGVFFLKVGAMLFGSGYVLASFLQSGLVEQYGWLTTRELNDAILVGQFTPGPLLTTATFIGYVLGHRTFAAGDVGGTLGAVLATVAIFFPSFLFLLVLAPVIHRLQNSPTARAALDAMNAAVVVLIGTVLYYLGVDAFTRSTGGIDGINFAIGLVSVAIMLRTNLNATWFVLGAMAIGILRMVTGMY